MFQGFHTARKVIYTLKTSMKSERCVLLNSKAGRQGGDTYTHAQWEGEKEREKRKNTKEIKILNQHKRTEKNKQQRG